MNDSQFQQLAIQLMSSIEERLDQFEGSTDIDCETSQGIMTLTFADKSQIIINTQEPLHQIWLATKYQAYHFNYIDGDWICTRQHQSLFDILSQACSLQAGESISF